MDAQGVSAGSQIGQAAQKAQTSQTPAAQPAQSADQPYLSNLERLGADHPLTKFLGGFWSQQVDVEA